MQTSDLRRPAQTATRDPRLPETLSVSQRDETERLFSAGVVTNLINLFEDGALQGRRVVTDSGPPAPVALTSVTAEPYARRLTELQQSKQALSASEPDARVRVTIGLYWDEVPFRLIEPNQVEVDAALFSDYPVDPAYTYRFVYAGSELTVISLGPNEKGNKIRFRLSGKVGLPVQTEAVAQIHGGATRVSVRVETPAFGKGLVPAASVLSDFEPAERKAGPNAPVYAVEISGMWPDEIALYLVASNRCGKVNLRTTVNIAVPRPPAPSSEALERRTSLPKMQATGSAIVRADTRAAYAAQVYKTEGAAIVGILVQPAARATPERSFVPLSETRYVPLASGDVQWQIESRPVAGPATTSEKAQGPVRTTRTIGLDLGPTETSAERDFLICWVDEMARTGPFVRLTLPAAPPVYLPSPDLDETFGRVAQLAIAPLAVDIEGVAERFVGTAQEIVRSAETRIESAVQGQPPVQQATPA